MTAGACHGQPEKSARHGINAIFPLISHHFEAVAIAGDGVFDTLKAVSKLVLKALA